MTTTAIGCSKCDRLACVCALLSAHLPDCADRRAATCAIPIECDHGFDVCPQCDPCTCADLVLGKAGA